MRHIEALDTVVWTVERSAAVDPSTGRCCIYAHTPGAAVATETVTLEVCYSNRICYLSDKAAATLGLGRAEAEALHVYRTVYVLYTVTASTAMQWGLVQCAACGTWIEAAYGIEAPNGNIYCDPSCASSAGWTVCDYCGEVIEGDGLEDCTEGTYCDEDCASGDGLVACDYCGSWTSETVELRDGDIVCIPCYEEHCYTCTDCGGVYDSRYDWPRFVGSDTYCQDCYDERAHGDIWSYHSWPGNYTPVGGDGLHMGVELETDNGDNEGIAHDIAIDLGQYYHCEHDSSLDDGVEIISQPMTVNLLLDTLPSVASIARDYNAESHEAGTCGFHIHLERAYFAERIGMYGDVVAENRLRVFFAAHQNELVRFSRRNTEQMSWCNCASLAPTLAKENMSEPGDGELKELAKAQKMKDAYRCDRYLAINGRNARTIEIRLWRGTLNRETLRATVSLTYALACFVVEHNDRECAAVPWSEFTAYALGIDETANASEALRSYLARRGL